MMIGYKLTLLIYYFKYSLISNSTFSEPVTRISYSNTSGHGRPKFRGNLSSRLLEHKI